MHVGMHVMRFGTGQVGRMRGVGVWGSERRAIAMHCFMGEVWWTWLRRMVFESRSGQEVDWD